ncbi:hypothetical protein K501DRAFT_332547 [Backusella circina FSU 941]|nr:hypothetical protein K501DRAFT_332547 [Backusella circina FSU 941]
MKHSVSIEAIEGALPELGLGCLDFQSVPGIFGRSGIRVSRVSFLLVELLRNCLSWVFMKTSQKVRVQVVPSGAATCLRDDLGSLAVWAGLSQSAGRFSLARLIAHVGWLYPSFVDLDMVCGLDLRSTMRGTVIDLREDLFMGWDIRPLSMDKSSRVMVLQRELVYGNFPSFSFVLKK